MRPIVTWLIASLLVIVPAEVSFAQKPADDQWQDMCAVVGKFAKRIMAERQKGTPMLAQMEAIGDKNLWSGLLKTAVRQAYTVPRFTSKRLKDEAAQDFEDRVFSDCLNGNDEK